MLILFLLTLGIVVGLISAFYGIGGGIVAIPAFYFFFPQMTPPMVIGTSLTMVFFNSLVNIIHFRKVGLKINWHFFFISGAFLIGGVAIGSHFVFLFSTHTVKMIFAFALLLVGILSMLRREKRSVDGEWILHFNRTGSLKLMSVSLLAGIFSGLTGLGGGLVMAPFLIFILRIPFRLVSFYSNMAIIISAGFGASFYLLSQVKVVPFANSFLNFGQIGQVNFSILILILSTAFIASRMAVKWMQHFPASVMKMAFVAMLLILSIYLFVSA